jgi:hypothetical protein
MGSPQRGRVAPVILCITKLGRAFAARTIALAICSCLLVSASRAQGPTERSFPLSKTDLQTAIDHSAGAMSGKLPILDGFVATGTDTLDSYRNGFYQLSVQIIPKSANESTVRVTAKVTAWYAGADKSRSGYQVLSSNGRLESDFLDRLEQVIQAKNELATNSPPNEHQGASQSPAPTTAAVPQSPSSLSAATAISKAATPTLPTREESARFAANSGNERRVQQLKQRINDLEQVLNNQSHPDNLIAVKHSGTPVYSRPFDQATVLFRAEAEDEFQIVTTAGSWVHVQVSGLSRGWIQRSDVDLLGSRATPVAADAPPAPTVSGQAAPSNGPYQTREETSMFPGNWAPLRGKTVKIIWVLPHSGPEDGDHNRVNFAKSLFRKAYPEVSKSASDVAGVVVVFDAEDGGMAAATTASLQQWSAGHLSDSAFWKQCWLDPAEAFKIKD